MADPTGSGSNGGTTTVVSNPPNLPTTNTVPNTTTDTKTVEFQLSAPGNTTGFQSIDNALGTLGTLFNTIVTSRNSTLTVNQSDAYYTGTGVPTAAQQLEQDKQTARDAAVLYPGTNNEALRNIDIGAGRIAANEVGITNAEKIIAANNAELADPFIPDARRLELEANNEAQLDYIQVATENTAIQQNIIEQNANVYAAGGGNPNSGQGPVEVSALEDPAVASNEALSAAAAEADAIVAEQNLAVDDQDPFEAARLAAIAAEEDGPTETDLEVDSATDEELAVQEAYQQDQRDQLAETFSPDAVADPDLIAAEEAALFDQQRVGPADPFGVLAAEDAALAEQEAARGDAEAFGGFARSVDQEQGSQEAAIRNKAKQQATIQARYKQPGNNDWRVRLSLGPGAKYLYNATPAGVLAPLAANGGTDGVIFPYTPSITTNYSANYEQYDLIHSNYRGLFYKNSRVGDIQLRGTFTAQNTTEANYLLATIHFFRSVTKMFYGQDAERGTPPPICLLNGFGGYQFSDHPVVISSFNYTLPNDVDYIRTTNPNNFGLDLNNRYNPSGASLPAGGALSGVYRLLNAIPNGLPFGAVPRTPAPNTVSGSVTNNVPASYVPTKMEIDVTLIPVQSRSQVSQQFSLKGFANGDLLKGGFW